MGVTQRLDGFFHITERGSDIRTEIHGGILVFLSMVYIIVVNTSMMVDAGMDYSACYSATIIMAVIGSLLMALYARYPVAMAPTMGVNAFFTYTVVIGLQFSWQEALLAVVISGVIFFVMAVSGVRKIVIEQIPKSLRHGITAGIGCFIVFIGLQNAGIIVDSPTLVGIGSFSDPSVILAMVCIILTLFMSARKVPGAIFIGMALTTLMGVVTGIITIPSSIVAAPAMPDIGAFLDGISPDVLSMDFLMVVVALTFVQFFDSTGTLMAIGERAGLIDEDGNVKCEEALRVDSATSVVSGIVGATPTGSYAESTVGIEAGARTGLMPLVVACLFAVSLMIGPLFSVVDYSCTIGAMLMVGAAMITQLKEIEWDDWPVSVAVLGTILMMVLAYSITDGIVFGVIFYCISMIGAGRWREVGPAIYILAVISVLYLILVVGSL